MSCPNVSIIQSNECIGNSLAGINDNFASLSEGICDNINRITDIENDITNLTTQLIALSGLVTPGAAKAWVVFDATRNTVGAINTSGSRRIINSYNVSNVQPGVAGQFTITFTNNLPNKNYGVIATCSEKTASSGNYVWAQPGPDAEKNESSLTIYTRSINSTDTASPEYVSVLIL
jgi:hypothetical protein